MCSQTPNIYFIILNFSSLLRSQCCLISNENNKNSSLHNVIHDVLLKTEQQVRYLLFQLRQRKHFYHIASLVPMRSYFNKWQLNLLEYF